MRRLTGLESFFLSAETPTNLFHVGAVTILDPSTAPDGRSPYDALCDVLEARIHLLAPFRRRLLTVPAGLDHARWVDAGDIDVRQHVVRAAIPPPGGFRELAAYAAEVMGRPLDRDRPLWEIHVVEGLEGGLVGAVAKIHHAAIDGLTGVELTAQMMDLTPEIRATPETPPARDDILPLPFTLAFDGVKELVRRGPAAVQALAQAALRVRHLRLHGGAGAAPAAPGLLDAPTSALGGRLSRRRAVAMTSVEREAVDRVRAATGATVNDVILTITTSALRDELGDVGQLPDAPLVAFVPVALKGGRGTTHDEMVNRLSGMLVSLPTTTEDAAEQLAAVCANAGQAKVQESLIGGALFGSVAEVLVPLVAGAINRGLSLVGPRIGWPPFNVVVSSFPGSPVPLYCGGSRLVAYHPLGPVIDGASLNITATSYGDQVSFGLLACEDIVPDVEGIADRLQASLGELVKRTAA